MERSRRLYSTSEAEESEPLVQGSTETSPSGSLPSPTPESTEAHRTDYERLLQAIADEANSDPDIGDVLHSCDVYGIPSLNIDHLGVGDYLTREPASLGGGLTARVVLHDTGDWIGGDVPTNTTVALKVFTADRHVKPAEAAAAPRRRIYKSILNEIRVLSHPELRCHPNIVQLIFVGWNAEEEFPFLATELGKYGSLDHILRDPACSPSTLQRRHITVDIAQGLQALHAAGIIHGDIKPDNIIVTHHLRASRQVTAKLADFGGSFLLTDPSSSRPAHFTQLWCAPEVLTPNHDTDWARADVYSYGLVIASLWAKNHDDRLFDSYEYSSSSVLADCLPTELGDQGAEEFLSRLKTQPEDCPESLISVITSRLTKKTLPPDVTPEELLGFLKLTLQATPRERPDSDELLLLLAPFTAVLKRDISPQQDIKHDSGASDGIIVKKTALSGSRLADILAEGTSGYQEVIYAKIRLSLDELNGQIENEFTPMDIPATLPHDLSTDEFLDMLFQATRLDGITVQAAPHLLRVIKKGIYLTILGNCCVNGSGTHVNRSQGLELLRDAGLCGDADGIHINTFGLDNYQDVGFPRRLYLALFALAGSRAALERLATDWPDHFRLVRRLITERVGAFRRAQGASGEGLGSKIDLLGSVGVVWIYQAETPTPESELTLHDALDAGAVEPVKTILNQATPSCDIVPGLLHRLPTFTDAEATEIASIARQKGALLIGTQSSLYQAPVVPTTMEVSSPLSAAILRSQPMLALTILQFHLEAEEPISDFSSCLIKAFVGHHWQAAEVLLRVLRERPELCFDPVEYLDPTKDFELNPVPTFTNLLLRASSDPIHYAQRMVHGPSFSVAYEQTLKMLLREGANPALGFHDVPGCTALGYSMIHDDVAKLELFVEFLEEQSFDVPSLLRDPCNMEAYIEEVRDEPFAEPFVIFNYSALVLCMRNGSLDCFEFLTNRYPVLITAESNNEGMTLLHLACAGIEREILDIPGMPFPFEKHLNRPSPKPPNPKFAELLLRAGADVLAKDRNGNTPLFGALWRADLSMADLFISFCSEAQLSELLSRDPESGRSMFSQLLDMDTWRIWPFLTRQPKLVDSLRWLEAHGAAYFYGRDNLAVWDAMFTAGPKLLRVDQSIDLVLIRYFLNSPAESIKNGLSYFHGLMHGAVCQSNVEIVRLLIERGFDVNSPLSQALMLLFADSPTSFFRTPLDVVQLAFMGNSLAQCTKHWTKLDVRNLWARGLEIARMLLEKGARGVMFESSLLGALFKGGGSQGWWTNLFSRREMQLMAENLTQQKHSGCWPELLPQSRGKSLDAEILIARVFKELTALKPGSDGADITTSLRPARREGMGRTNTSGATRSSTSPPKNKEDDVDSHGNTRLHFAVLSVDIEILRRVLPEAVNVGQENHDGMTPLDVAVNLKIGQTEKASSGHATPEEVVAIVRMLLEAGADPNRIPPKQVPPPLHRCLEEQKSLELVEALVQGGAYVNLLDIEMTSPLCIAVKHGQEKHIALLLSAGADPTQPVDSIVTTTVIHIAAGGNKADILALLLDSQNKSTSTTTRPLDVDLRDSDGNTPLCKAAEQGAARSTEVLLDHGADVNKTNLNGQAPLHIAASGHHLEVMEVLIARGADINLRTNANATYLKGTTPLIQAALMENWPGCDLLIARGADTSVLAEYEFAKTTEGIMTEYSLRRVSSCQNSSVKGDYSDEDRVCETIVRISPNCN